MTTSSNQNKPTEGSLNVEKPQSKIANKVDSPELKNVSEIGRAAYTEAVGVDESVETVGEVSEAMSENKERSAGGGAKSQGNPYVRKPIDPNEIRAKILKNLPTEAVMLKQIEDEVKREINYLHRKAMKMVNSPGQVSYFEMSNIMKKIRELKGILALLAKATLESLKTLWLRFVHGVM